MEADVGEVRVFSLALPISVLTGRVAAALQPLVHPQLSTLREYLAHKKQPLPLHHHRIIGIVLL